MGLAVAQMITFGASIEVEVQTQILQNKISDLWQKHSGQITAISTLYTQMEKMSFNQSLFDQINTSNQYSIENWGFIAKEIQAQINLVDTINQSFQDTKANSLSLTEVSNAGLSMSIVGFSFATLMFWKQVAPKQYQAIKTRVKQMGNTIFEKVKFAGRKLRISSYNEQGTLQKQEIPPEVSQTLSIQPEIKSPANKAKIGAGTVAMTFMRIGFLAYMIYSVYKGIKHIEELKIALTKDRDYFAQNGSFQKQMGKVNQAIKIFSCDVPNLAEASRAVIENFHNLYLTKAFLQAKPSSYYAKRAGELTTAEFDLTDAFIQKTIQLRDSISDSDKHITDLNEKLNAFVTHFNTFYETKGTEKSPDTIFLNVTAQISSIVGKDSIANEDLFQQQQKLFDLADKISRSFINNRGPIINIHDFSIEELQLMDEKILSDAQRYYKSLIIEVEPDDNLNKKDEQIIGSMITNYCDKFYATDITGKTIYGNDFSSFKGKSTYAELLEDKKHQSQAQNIPVHYDDEQLESKQVIRLLNIARGIAISSKKEQFSDLTDQNFGKKIPAKVSRYLNLIRQPTGETQKDVPKIKLVGSNGLKFKYRGNTYLVQEEIVSLNTTLRKAGAI